MGEGRDGGEKGGGGSRGEVKERNDGEKEVGGVVRKREKWE